MVTLDGNLVKTINIYLNKGTFVHVKTTPRTENHYVRSPYPKDPNANLISFSFHYSNAPDTDIPIFYEISQDGKLLEINNVIDPATDRQFPTSPSHLRISVPTGIDINLGVYP